nr:hypothetical protein BaRGS_004653 [Batillaria attramentaria]
MRPRQDQKDAKEDKTKEERMDDRNGGSETRSPGTMASAVSYVLERLVTPAICSLGLVLNVVNLLVLTERVLKESPYVYLRALSVTDFSALFMTVLFLLSTDPPPNGGYLISDGSAAGDFGVTYGAYIFYPLSSVCNNASTWLVVTLTIERYLFVRYPLWARDKCSPTSAKVKVVLVLVVVVLFNLPRFLYYRVVPDSSSGGRLQMIPGDFRYSETARHVQWMYSFLFGVLPLLVLCSSNTYLVYAVRRARRQRRQLHIRNNMEAHWNREQTRLTLTLISIVFLAILCILPAAFGDVAVSSTLLSSSHSLRDFIESDLFKVFRSVSNLLLVCNMALNFFLYSAFNDKFVRVMKKMLRRWMDKLHRRGDHTKQAAYAEASHRTAAQRKTQLSSIRR